MRCFAPWLFCIPIGVRLVQFDTKEKLLCQVPELEPYKRGFLFLNPLRQTLRRWGAFFNTTALSILGVEAIVVDYIRPSLFNGSTTIPNIAQGCVWALSIVTLAGLYYFNYTDVGIINAIKMLWKL